MNDPEEVVVDFKESRIVDMSAIDALDKLSKRYRQEGKTLFATSQRRLPENTEKCRSRH
jgi:MFS superfamily sulfate permease-like transporter